MLFRSSSSNLIVDDPLVYFSSNAPYPYNYDIGFFSAFTGGAGNTYQHTGLVRDYTDGTWKLFSNVPEPSGRTLDFTNAIYDPLQLGALTGTTGNFSSTLSVTSNANIGNIGTGGLITATGNITGGNLVTGGALSVTGNANVGNIGATLHVGNLSGTGNSNVGNLGATGDRKSTRLNSSHSQQSRMPSSA